ncbi:MULTISPECIES: alpha/beta fold hydrolase [unclassified Clostridioides]|uniref:alpha/beta hydrolase family protein n=1 Tax=unclassified Clostridioides TaxID=2635829 RepID=UPI001D1076E5|nr:alpha/beta hydrolase [Clostridioides sp. ES-S-0171-01]MCC0688861.1 alpha/beta hydrolase [Clostridioides sp. ES-S-0056-01]UDN53516.1 alpha/beta hydrolase [Clostridioides sp. ES-S-0054-01]
MGYTIINPIPQFNFQANRVLTYGELACNREIIKARIPEIQTFEDWYMVWSDMARCAEKNNHYLHAAYYYRMAEFFLKANDERKESAYDRCINCFYRGFDLELHLHYEKVQIPFEGKHLYCLKLSHPHPKGTVIVCGGYDSFIEEFVLQVHELVSQGYEILLFDGPGQGKCLKEKLYFRFDFEKATSTILTYFHIEKCAMVGISWGGYFALRSAAYEKRISAVVAYDVMDNGFEVMTNIFPLPICKIIQFAYYNKWERLLNGLTGIIARNNVLADWALSQGMYITGSKSPFEFYQNLSYHNLSEITGLITQDVLLLAGEKDHYIPLKQFYRLEKSINHAKSLSCRLFTIAEGGEQHCQIGNHMLAVNTIINWLGKYFLH